MTTEEERMSILRRYIRDPLSDDTELYYSGMLGSCDLSKKVYVACSVLSEWRKQRKESENKLIKKRKFVDFLYNFPKSKRTSATIPNPVFKNQKNPIYNKKTPKKPEVLPSSTKTDLPLTFKLVENNLFSVKKSNNDVTIIPQKLLSKKRSQDKYEGDCTRVKKKIKTEQLHHPVEPIYVLENNNISANLKARLLNNKAVLVIKKNLTKTDVAENNQRLSIPKSQIKSPNFLTEEELISLTYKEGAKVVPHLYAKLIEPCGDECDIKLARWKMRSNFVFNIFGSWKEVVPRNNLRENTLIEVYSFREDSHLYFAVIRV